MARGLVERVLLASPRGYCAGVERAVETVERALERYGAPVYVRKQIVHNAHVVRELEARGAVFVEDEHEVPPGATVVFSAHGVAPSVHAAAAARRLATIDATERTVDDSLPEASGKSPPLGGSVRRALPECLPRPAKARFARRGSHRPVGEKV